MTLNTLREDALESMASNKAWTRSSAADSFGLYPYPVQPMSTDPAMESLFAQPSITDNGWLIAGMGLGAAALLWYIVTH